MRFASVITLCALACSPAPRALPGARVDEVPAPVGVGSERRFVVTPAQDGTLSFALGDRVPDLDLTPPPPRVTGGDPGSDAGAQKLADALLAFTPVRAGEPVTIVMRARPWRGDDVVRSLVAPLTDEAAVQKLAEAAPELHKRQMIRVELVVAGGGRTQSIERNIVIAPGSALGAAIEPRVAHVALGEPQELAHWVMAAASGYVPPLHREGTRVLAFDDATNREVPVDALATPVWTLWLQLEP